MSLKPLRNVVLAVGVFTLPANADTAPTCWDYGAHPGVFGWYEAPSTACRAGKTVTGADAGPAPTPIAAAPNAAPAPGPSDTPVTFSGEAYLGVAVSF